jgi:riboflavin synthase
MFTGIITGVGRIAAVHDLGSSLDHGKRLTIEAPGGYLDDVALGDSIALNGACMTVTTLDPSSTASPSTFQPNRWTRPPGWPDRARSTWKKPCAPSDRLGGHIVSGHVDGVGRVTRFEQVGESWELAVLAPTSLCEVPGLQGLDHGQRRQPHRQPHVQDGPQGCEISINLIPHTVENTALGALHVDGSPSTWRST